MIIIICLSLIILIGVFLLHDATIKHTQDNREILAELKYDLNNNLDEVVYVGNNYDSKLTRLYYGEIYQVYEEDAEYIRVYNNRKDLKTGDIIGINKKEDFIKL